MTFIWTFTVVDHYLRESLEDLNFIGHFMSLSFERRFSLNRRPHKKLLINNIAIENLLFIEDFFYWRPTEIIFFYRSNSEMPVLKTFRICCIKRTTLKHNLSTEDLLKNHWKLYSFPLKRIPFTKHSSTPILPLLIKHVNWKNVTEINCILLGHMRLDFLINSTKN